MTNGRAGLGALTLLLATLVTTSGCAQGCATGLVRGELVAVGSELQLGFDGGLVTPVAWPDGLRVVGMDNGLAVVHVFGTAQAREGDMVELGGGEDPRYGTNPTETWRVCGLIRVPEE